METKIKQTTINTIEVAETENASFDLVVTRVDGAVTKIVANISAQQSHIDEFGMTVHSLTNIGSISFFNGTLSASGIPADDKAPLLFSDFINIINSIKQRI